MDIQRAINHLVSLGFKLPYNITPGSFPGGIDSEFDAERWLTMDFNPPNDLAHLSDFSKPDLEASAKFSWRQIMWADGVAELEETRVACFSRLDEITTAHIANLYHPDGSRNRNKEWQIRLSGIDLTDKDAQRLRTIKVYDGLKSDIKAATTLAELAEIEGRRDAAGLGS